MKKGKGSSTVRLDTSHGAQSNQNTQKKDRSAQENEQIQANKNNAGNNAKGGAG